uniref:uncharacterized protein LOC131102958 n=1 Tax=Doryrhamphus excisus TaxID=161450 RepID=UPI0025ADF361|nr:uncharacterized protein LOC131102958 [Doryrhamphus excisus]
MLTDCLPASASPPEDPVRDLFHYPIKTRPVALSAVRDSPAQQELRMTEEKQEVTLLLTESEIRALSPLEAQELNGAMGVILPTRTISAHVKLSDVHLNERPQLLLFREETTLKDAYKILLYLLESAHPQPQPRRSSFARPSKQSSLLMALRSGIETGEVVLKLQPNLKASPDTPSLETSDSASEKTPSGQNVCHSTYKRLDSLEETIRELENTLIEISGGSCAEELYSTIPPSPASRKPPVPPKPTSSQVHFSRLASHSFFISSLRAPPPGELSDVCSPSLAHGKKGGGTDTRHVCAVIGCLLSACTSSHFHTFYRQ